MTDVRRARAGDLPELVALIAEHAVYEKAEPPGEGLAGRLEPLLFGSPEPRLIGLVAELGEGGPLVGYATCSAEVSTWDGAEYLHMDCLFLRDGHRGLGIGESLMDAVRGEARRLGLGHVQWQTPVWNDGAIRFYTRIGATSKDKRRFFLPVR
ncbi:ribosomal protein S18 acetylase RimI-like enzyme [Streptomyces sp. TLI_55]|uniref:GNAT family N-acetyltransferase n=1 Tax=Streptomyces sp. TLI_55 TaxID=1938861 RepID=UPI000BD7567B|nr:GNAT family N-acetyltransferase [Streptomyces sp. TLI_55]SNX62555.1 ribosomal protein S18 acetylase RimI-like enzyme [Streptomyces sp. TLI_55]